MKVLLSILGPTKNYNLGEVVFKLEEMLLDNSISLDEYNEAIGILL